MPYERHYEVGLLDDLHNFFPALLYDQSRFQTVQDVLGYIRFQTSERFNLYRRGMEAHFAVHPPVPRVAAGPPSVAAPHASGLSNLETLFRGVNRGGATAAVPIVHAAPAPTTVDIITETLMGDDQGVMNLFGSLLGLGGIGNRTVMAQPGGHPGFMEPVVVRPTREQIESGSAIEIVDAENEVCAICQDELSAGTQARSLIACDHRFHVGCIDTWFERNVRCPVCRHDIRERPAADMTAVD